MPRLSFETAKGDWLTFGEFLAGLVVLYMFPGIDDAHERQEDRREHDAYRRAAALLSSKGIGVASLSSQPSRQQIDSMLSLQLPYRMLLDPQLQLAEALQLPVGVADGRAYYKRLTLLIRNERIQHVFYPVTRAERNPEQILAWMTIHG